MSQALYYPSPSLTLSAIGANGAAIPTTAILVGGSDGTNLRPLLTDSSGHLIVDGTTTGGATAANQVLEIAQLTAISGKLPASLGSKLSSASLSIVLASDGTLPLPTGAATAANQATEIASLASIDTKTPALGQALAASSVPVVLTAAQLSTLTPLATVAATQSGTWNITNVSGTVSLPTGASTESTLSTLNGKFGTLGQKAMAGSAPVVIASDQSAIPVSGTVSVSGGATAARQDTGNTSLASIDTKTPALGQALAAASVPVVLTASQLSTLTPLSSVAATQSGTWTVQPGNTANTTAWLVNSQAKTPTAGTITMTALTVGTSAVRLTVSGSAPSATRSVLIATPDSTSTATFYIGSASVTNSGSTRGAQITAGQAFTANNDAGDYYIVSSASSQTVYVTEQA